MENQTAYLFTGYAAAGKSSLAEMIAEEKDIPFFEMGDAAKNVVLEYTDETEESLNYEKLSSLANEVREEHGGEVYAERVSEVIPDESDVVISGVRSVDEITHYEQVFDKVKVIAIEAPFELRLERIVKRGNKDEEEYVRGDLEQRDNDERERGINETIENADIRITNTQSIQNSVVSLLEELN